MKRFHWRRLGLRILLLGGAGLLRSSRAQNHPPALLQDPQWFKINAEQFAGGLYSEGQYETTTYKNTGQSTTTDRYFVGPLIGLNVDGSVYHPNFLSFQALADGSYGYSTQDSSSGGRTTTTGGMDLVGTFQANAQFLDHLPFNFSLDSGYSRSYQDYDFFNRVTLQSYSYGGRARYHSGPWTILAFYKHSDQEIIDSIFGSSTVTDTAGLTVHHDRARGSSDFTYTFSEYTLSDYASLGNAQDNTFTFGDSERFGGQGQYRVQTGVNYDLRQGEPASSEQWAAFENWFGEHRFNLTSSGTLAYNWFSTEGTTSSSYVGDASVTHKLYESLTSTLDVHGESDETDGPGSTATTSRMGVLIAEGYTKQIGFEHALHISESVETDAVSQEGASVVVNEQHSFSSTTITGNGVFLNLPDIDPTSIVVMDANRIKTYSPALDYEVIQVGAQTMLTLRAGTTIPPGSLVSVDYHAIPTGSGSYQTFSDYAQIRLDLWHNVAGVYARFGLLLDNAPPGLLVQSLVSYAFGADFHWRCFGASAEYDIYDSNEAQFNALRLNQHVHFEPDQSSSVGLNLGETFTRYQNPDRRDDDYRLTAFYRYHFSRALRLNVEAGVDQRQGAFLDQTLAAFRPTLNYVIGKTTISASYDYEYGLYLNTEERQRHEFTFRLRRVF